MEWLVIFTIAAVIGSTSCYEPWPNVPYRHPQQNFNPYFSGRNLGPIRQPSGHWNLQQNNVKEPEWPDELDEDYPAETDEDPDFESDTELEHDSGYDSDFDEELAPKSESGSKSKSDSDGDRPMVTDGDPDFESDTELEFDSGYDSEFDEELDPESEYESDSDDDSLDDIDENYDIQPPDEEESSSSTLGTFKASRQIKAPSDPRSDVDSPTLKKKLSSFANRFIGKQKLSSRNHSNDHSKINNTGKLQNLMKDKEALKSNMSRKALGKLFVGSLPRDGSILHSIVGGIIDSIDPQEILSAISQKKIPKIDNMRKSLLDYRERTLDERLGTLQRGELNQFDPKFQESLSNSVKESSRISSNVVPNSQREKSVVLSVHEENGKPSKKNIISILGGIKHALTPELNKKRVSTEENGEGNKNHGGKLQFLSKAKSFAVNPVGFVKKKMKDKVKQTVKNEMKHVVGEVANRVLDFKGNMSGWSNELKDSFIPRLSKSTEKKSRSSDCLKVVKGPYTNTLYLNGKVIPEARIIHKSKDHRSELKSYPLDYQHKILKDCLSKGNVLLMCQPDAVKVEEEHSRQLEMIIAKDVVKDNVNSWVDRFFQKFGDQLMTVIHLMRPNNDD